MEPKLIAAMKRALAAFSAAPPGEASTSLLHNSAFSRIVNANHYKRISKLLDGTKGDIVVGGKRDDKENKIEVTIVRNVKGDDTLMSGALPLPRLSLPPPPHELRADVEVLDSQRRSSARSCPSSRSPTSTRWCGSSRTARRPSPCTSSPRATRRGSTVRLLLPLELEHTRRRDDERSRRRARGPP